MPCDTLNKGDTMGNGKNSIGRLTVILKKKARTVTEAVLWDIPHKTEGKEDVSLKIGRYKTGGLFRKQLDVSSPKSELTLDFEELQALIKFLSENYEPFKKGVKKFIPIDERFDQCNVEHLRAIFRNPDKKEVLAFVSKNNIMPDDLIIGFEQQKRANAIKEFETMLNKDLLEEKWQEWFKKNDWVLGSDCVRILDERVIDTSNITDYLAQAYDGFLDIIEIKRPEGRLRFWSEKKDHDNDIPSNDLIKAITQATKYIYEVEREANSVKFLEKVGYVKTVKPRCILIFGRSNEWDLNKMESFRILNSSYHNLSIMTYDHVLSRARRIVGI